MPEELRRASDTANRRDFTAIASGFAQTVRCIFAKDAERFAARRQAVEGKQNGTR